MNVSNHPAWPQRHLLTPRNPSHYGLALEQIHPSLRTAIEDCCANMARFTPLNPRQTKVYSRHTINATRGILLRATGIRVRKGADLSGLQGMHDILCPAAIRCVLEEHAERLGNGDGWAASSSTVAVTLKRTARISSALEPGPRASRPVREARRSRLDHAAKALDFGQFSVSPARTAPASSSTTIRATMTYVVEAASVDRAARRAA